MALNFNGTNITKVILNNVEQPVLNYNGVNYFGKQYTLVKNASTGVTFSVTRTSSPNQKATTGNISDGNTIYYGDVLTITVTAMSGFTNPVLYVNTGDGTGLKVRTSPYTFTVSNNITLSGTATESSEWQTVWTGTQSFTDTGSFTVPGLVSGGEVQVTANVEFAEYYIESEESVYEGNTYYGSANREKLPTTIYGNLSSLDLSREGNQITFTFNGIGEYMKGFYLYEVPTMITITEVRRKT